MLLSTHRSITGRRNDPHLEPALQSGLYLHSWGELPFPKDSVHTGCVQTLVSCQTSKAQFNGNGREVTPWSQMVPVPIKGPEGHKHGFHPNNALRAGPWRTQSHRIRICWAGRDPQDYQAQLLTRHRTIPDSHTRCLRASSKGFLSSVTPAAVTTSLGSLFQCPATLCMKNLLLISRKDTLTSLKQLKAISLSPAAGHHREEISACLFSSRGSCKLGWGFPSVPSSPGWTERIPPQEPQCALGGPWSPWAGCPDAPCGGFAGIPQAFTDGRGKPPWEGARNCGQGRREAPCEGERQRCGCKAHRGWLRASGSTGSGIGIGMGTAASAHTCACAWAFGDSRTSARASAAETSPALPPKHGPSSPDAVSGQRGVLAPHRPLPCPALPSPAGRLGERGAGREGGQIPLSPPRGCGRSGVPVLRAGRARAQGY